jgi:hypothetical protein
LDGDRQDAVTPPHWKASRGTPRWALWLTSVLILAVIGGLIGAWFWMQRRVQFEERDVYGTWVSDGRHPTTLEFKQDGVVIISGAPLPESPDDKDCPLFGKTAWDFARDKYHPWVSVGRTCGDSIYAENHWLFSTVLVLYIDDSGLPGTRVVFTHTTSATPSPSKQR